MLFAIQKRKIGPGLKASLKWFTFNHKSVQIQFKPLSIIETHMPKLPFDAELYAMILKDLNATSSTRRRFIQSWFPKDVTSITPVDAGFLIAGTGHIPGDEVTRQMILAQARQLLRSSIINPAFDDFRKIAYMQMMVQYNHKEQHFSSIDAMEFIRRNVKDQSSDQFKKAIEYALCRQSYEQLGPWDNTCIPSLPLVQEYIVDKVASNELPVSTLRLFTQYFITSLKPVLDNKTIKLVPKVHEDTVHPLKY